MMNEKMKMLYSFLTVENPQILISPCSLREEMGFSEEFAKCTSDTCEQKKNCIVLNPAAMFLPLKKFHAWIADISRFKANTGYAFHLARQTLKDNGVLVIINANPEDYIALSYGFQPLYHEKWHYFLKA